MQKSGGGFIALLLVIAIMLSLPNTPDYGYESPRTVCGDSIAQSETYEDNEDETLKVILIVIIVLIVIFIIYCITGSDNQSHERR